MVAGEVFTCPPSRKAESAEILVPPKQTLLCASLSRRPRGRLQPTTRGSLWHFGGISVGTVAGNSGLPFHRTSEKPRRRWAAALSAAASLSLLLCAMPGTPVRADVVVNNINVGEGASDIVVNPVTNTVYVTTNDGLTIINGSTQATATAKVKTGGVPADRDGTR